MRRNAGGPPCTYPLHAIDEHLLTYPTQQATEVNTQSNTCSLLEVFLAACILSYSRAFKTRSTSTHQWYDRYIGHRLHQHAIIFFAWQQCIVCFWEYQPGYMAQACENVARGRCVFTSLSKWQKERKGISIQKITLKIKIQRNINR